MEEGAGDQNIKTVTSPPAMSVFSFWQVGLCWQICSRAITSLEPNWNP